MSGRQRRNINYQQVTGGIAVIESAAVLLPGAPGQPLWKFVGATQLNDDPSIWCVPTAEGLRAMCVAAGFSEAEIVSGRPRRERHRLLQSTRYRTVVHATP